MPFEEHRSFMQFPQAVVSKALHTHAVARGSLEGSPKTWIVKQTDRPNIAKIELLAQEFFRLLIPTQPETRLAIDDRNIHYILSEEVHGYRDLPVDEAQNFANGTYKGLGQVMLASMFLQEIDLKNGNLGIDKNNRVTKIDGDWCFAEGRFWGGPYDITAKAIAALPYRQDFFAYNWLDLTTGGFDNPTSSIVNPALSQEPQYRSEVNQTMLAICLLPDDFIYKFVRAYMHRPDKNLSPANYVSLLKQRRDELRISAMQDPAFCEYIETIQAKESVAAFVAHMTSFQANREQLISVEDGVELLNINVSGTKNLVLKYLSHLLDNVQSHRVGTDDPLLEQYVEETRLRIARNDGNLHELLEIKKEVSGLIESVGSPEVIAVKQSIAKLYQDTGLLTVGKHDKAGRIEKALRDTPLHERRHIISHGGAANPVQEALASHRLLGKKGFVYKNEDNAIDEKKAAATFKDLKRQFSEAAPRPDNENEEGEQSQLG